MTVILKLPSKPQFNLRHGAVVDYDSQSGFYTVRLFGAGSGNQQTVKVTGENIDRQPCWYEDETDHSPRANARELRSLHCSAKGKMIRQRDEINEMVLSFSKQVDGGIY